MSSLLRDLLAHQAWADAQHWRAIEAHPRAREDQTLRNRVHHIHLVQRRFIWMVGDRAVPFNLSEPKDFATFEALKAFAREVHAEIDRFTTSVSDLELSQPVTISGF